MIQDNSVSLMQVSHHYDELDNLYREMWGTHLHHGLWIKGDENKIEATINLSKEVLSYLAPLEDHELLDIGCGYGETAKLAIDLGARRVTGITISEKQFEYARLHTDGHPVDYQLSDWLDNEFASESFDGAYSIECFSHIADKKRYFEQVYRTLKPGSTFVMSAWLASENPSKFQKKFILEPICREGRLPSLYNKEEVMDEFEHTGFKFFDFLDLSHNVSKTWSISTLEILKMITQFKGLKYFFSRSNQEKKFALSALRILLGYKLGCFKYGLFVMTKD